MRILKLIAIIMAAIVFIFGLIGVIIYSSSRDPILGVSSGLLIASGAFFVARWTGLQDWLELRWG